MCLLLLFRGCAAAFFAGILLAFSVTSHLYLVILAGCLVPLVVGARWRDRRVLFCNQLPWLLGGFLLTLAAAYYWYAVHCGIGAFWQPTLELMRKMSGGDTSLWKKPLVTTLSEIPLWFAPCFFLAWAVSTWQYLDTFARGAFFALLLSTILFWAGDIIGGAYALSAPGYFSFLLPVILFSLIAFAGNAARHTKSSEEYLIFVLCAAAAVAGPVIFKAQSKWPWQITFSLCAIAVLGCSLYFFRRAFQQTAFIFCLLSCSFLSLATGFYAQFLADVRVQNSKDQKIPALAVKLKQMLPLASEGDVIKFWYPESENIELKMLQSFFLHTFSLLPGQSGFSTYPNATAADGAAIKAAGVQDIVLLDTDAVRLNSAMDSLSKAGLSFDTAQANIQRLGRENIFVQRLKIQTPVFSSWMPLDLRTIQVAKNAAVEFGRQSVVVTTSHRRWNFDSWIPIPKNDKNFDFGIKLQVLSGRVEVCLISKDSADRDCVTASVEVWPTPYAVEYVLKSSGSRTVDNLLIRNKMPDTTVSKVEIYEVKQRTD